MITIRDRRQGQLFDPWEHLGPQRRKLLKQSWAGVIRQRLLKHLTVAEVAASFQSAYGRPSKDLHVAIGALLLQQLHDFTDQQTTEALAPNLALHYALDIQHEEEAYLCERTLRNNRERILVGQLDHLFSARSPMSWSKRSAPIRRGNGSIPRRFDPRFAVLLAWAFSSKGLANFCASYSIAVSSYTAGSLQS